jgi:hypothetical protein
VGVHAIFLESMLAKLGSWPVTRPDEEVTSWLLEVIDVPKPDRLARLLATSTDPAVAFLWSQFSEQERTDLEKGEQVASILLDRLNTVMRGPSFYSAERFATRSLDRTTRALLEDSDRTAAEELQLNRLLIEATLGRHVRASRTIRPLDRLTTRDPSDFTIALLDSWATVADVVSFYQERLTDEGYLRTATERRSVLELARLIGYELRPGVAASVFVAFTLQADHKVEIPAGTLTKSTPAPGQLPQPFETSEPLVARAEWNLLAPRTSRPQRIGTDNARTIDQIYFAGTATKLAKNDVLLLAFGSGDPFLRRVEEVIEDAAASRTTVRLQPVPGALAPPPPPFIDLGSIIPEHLDLTRFGVANTATAARVKVLLDRLTGAAEAGDPAETAATTRTTLRRLELEHHEAVERGRVRIARWLSSLTTALDRALGDATRPAPGTQAATRSRSDDAQGKPLTMLDVFDHLELGEPLTTPRSLPPTDRFRLPMDLETTFSPSGDLRPRLLTRLQPAYKDILYRALAGAQTQAPQPVDVSVFRVRSPLYGYNAPQLRDVVDGELTDPEDPPFNEAVDTVDLAQAFDDIVSGSWIVVQGLRSEPENGNGNGNGGVIDDELDDEDDIDQDPFTITLARAGAVVTVGRADYGVSSTVTRVKLVEPSDPSREVVWFDDADGAFELIRTTQVLAQPERLELTDEPLMAGGARSPGTTDLTLEPIAGNRLELAGLYDGLEPGRWLIVAGERADIEGVTGVMAAELVMIGGVDHSADPDLPGDQLHTTITLAGLGASGSSGLSYSYRRETVRLYGNVVKATHGETTRQVLGSGNGGVGLQQFALGRKPLTFVSSPTPSGATPALELRVDGTRWSRVESLVEAVESDRIYVVRTNDDAVTTVAFGDGQHGARLPSGAENVTASYRVGLGLVGNVPAGQIDTLIDRPLGVKEVINPIEASGGGDRETRDQARSNAPLAVMSLDRLVSVIDYADFARMFAGVAKADARLLPLGRRRVLHLTVALGGDASLERNSDVYRNLRKALDDQGDPSLEIRIDGRILRLVILSARVRIAADELWDQVEPRIRAALAGVLGFDGRLLGQSMALSEVVAVIDGVSGVEYVDVDAFDWVDDRRALERDTAPVLSDAIEALAAHVDEEGGVVPAQLAYVDPTVSGTVILQELVR